MDNGLVIKEINDTERSMGFISLAKKNTKIFPRNKEKIKIYCFPFKEPIFCTYDPKYNRIYGLRKLFLKYYDMSSLKIKLLKKNTYVMIFKK